MDRKTLILQANIPKRPEILEEGKLVSLVDEAAALASMRESRGWKLLYSKFIEPRMSLERLLTARGPFKRAEEMAAVRELDLLMKFVNGRVEDGQRANDQLETLRKQ